MEGPVFAEESQEKKYVCMVVGCGIVFANGSNLKRCRWLNRLVGTLRQLLCASCTYTNEIGIRTRCTYAWSSTSALGLRHVVKVRVDVLSNM